MADRLPDLTTFDGVLFDLDGVLTPTAGRVRVAGRVSSLLELGAGFNPEMTGLENVYLQGTLMGFTRGEMDERRDAILAFADIGTATWEEEYEDYKNSLGISIGKTGGLLKPVLFSTHTQSKEDFGVICLDTAI